MLFKLSLKNISKSIKDYAIYFFTLILGVAIFYVFNAIDDQSVMMKVSSTTAEIIKLMTNVLSGVSVFVSIILAFLIVYASRFLIKRRNKEFGVYLTLGMSKKKISLILFIETLIIGIVSLVVGLGIGFLLSQLMSILVANYSEYVEFRNEGLKVDTILNINEKELKPKYDSCVEGFIAMNSTYSNMGVFVVPDNAVNDSMKKYEYLTANYNVTDINEKNLSEKELSEICKENSNNTVIDFDSKMVIKENSIGLGAMVTFIGLYLGIIFLISCAAILALKELSESSDNVEKFNMLRKIGVDEKMINKALFRQIGIFFMFPLLVAIIHSVFGIKFCNFLLSSFGAANLVSSIIGVAIFIVAIYGGYFLVTYICSKNIIKEK